LKLGLECDGAQALMIGGPNACPVKAHSKPWIARMLESNEPLNKWNHICGGTIVSKNLVLTANHCVDQRHPDNYLVAVGDHDIMKDDGEQTIEVADELTPNEGIGIKPELDNDSSRYKFYFYPK
jgi:secreted trypsin-like serine protease